jgi:methylase of polypeptide subunit release factors
MVGEVRFLMAPTLYPPDEWTEALLVGLSKHLTAGESLGKVAEIGVGQGIIPLCLTTAMRYTIERYLGLDINPIACEVARLNLSLSCPELECRFIVTDVGAMEVGEEKVDLVVANVPQMPCVSRRRRIDTNNYYSASAACQCESSEVERLIDAFGLRMIYDVLVFAHHRLRASGVAIFTLSGRCGDAQVRALLESVKLKTRVIHTTRVRQDTCMNLKPLLVAERSHQRRCQFYAKEADTIGICAEEAISRIRRGQHVYHDLHVVLGQIC